MPWEVIAGSSVTLRMLDVEMVTPRYVDWLNDPEVNRFLEIRFQKHDTEAVRGFVAAVAASPVEHLFAIMMTGQHVGNIKVGPIKPHHAVADVSLLIGDRSAWGKGVATEAISLISRWSFEKLGLDKLSASMYAPNQASYRAFLKAGYQHEGLRKGHYRLDGLPCDLLEVGLCRDTAVS